MNRSQTPNTVAIIGLGVIGGSIGLALRAASPRVTVVGLDNRNVLRRAKKRGAIEIAASSLRDALSDADVVFVCTPVGGILKLLPEISRLVKPGAIVTDVGSVKGVIQSCAQQYFRSGGIFIGGHPMAGSEGSGIEYADALLFQNAVYVLCPFRKKESGISRLAPMLKRIGARVLIMDAHRHDETAAAVSHLPQLLAVALVDFAARNNVRNPALFQLAAGGFRDMTRIASSPFPIWKDILAQNKDQVRSVLRKYELALKELEKDLSKKSLSAVERKFLRAKNFRDSIPRNSKGYLHSLHDVFVSVDDRPGVLAKMTSALSLADINISDIELMKVREGQGGTFRLSFESEEVAAAAAKVLRAKGIRVAK
jgi:prephenate dehydrogenase